LKENHQFSKIILCYIKNSANIVPFVWIHLHAATKTTGLIFKPPRNHTEHLSNYIATPWQPPKALNHFDG